MKDKEEIVNLLAQRAYNCNFGEDGCGGIAFYNGVRLAFIFSFGMGWEHLSVSKHRQLPTWDELCYMKRIFWDDDECCVQYFPAASEYVNNHPNCLHIWKPIGIEIPTPPKILV